MKPHLKTKAGFRLARKQGFQNLRLRIFENHLKIKSELLLMVKIAHKIGSIISEGELKWIIDDAENKAATNSSTLRAHLKDKFDRLLPSHKNDNIDKSKWIMNLSSKELTEAQISVLQRGLNFSVTPRNIPKASMVASIESGIRNLPDSSKSIIRSQVANILRSAKPPRCNLSADEINALRTLKKDSSIVIQPADKGNATVIMDRSSYEEKLDSLLSDNSIYEKLKRDPTKCTERNMNRMLLRLKNEGKFPDAVYYKLRSTDAVCSRIYGLPKIHKDGIPLRPIVSFVNSPTYNLSKYLCRILSPLLESSDVDVTSTFDFVEFLQTIKWRQGDVMISCDVQSLFTCVPVELAVSVAEERLHDHLQDNCLLSVSDIITLLRFCLNSSEFCSKGLFYRQKFGCPMGSPVSVIVANLVMQHIENKILSNNFCDVLFWRRYVDDAWAIIPEQNVVRFVDFINTIEDSIKFTVEREDHNLSLPFLDILISRNPVDCSFKISLFSKPTQSNRYLQFSSHNPMSHKRTVVKCLTKRSTLISSDDDVSKFQTGHVLNALLENGYPYHFIRKNVFSRNHVTRDRHDNVCSVCLPYVSKTSESIARVLRRYKINTVYKPCLRIRHFLPTPKDRVGPAERCGIVYRIKCNDCDLTYIGQSGNSLNTRVSQHRSALRLFHPQKSAVAEHSLNEDHKIDWKNVDVLEFEPNFYKRLFLEAWHSKRSRVLNRCDLNVPSVYSII